MLRELPHAYQPPGEPRRRWFFGHDLDLVVWEDEGGAVVGFQLAYDKHRDEHSIAWRRAGGFAHYVVDDGEEPRAGVKASPLLYANGPFQPERVLERFAALAAEVPPHIVACVTARLRELEGG